MHYKHFIDKYCKIPECSLIWFRADESTNSSINVRFQKHEEPFDDDLP